MGKKNYSCQPILLYAREKATTIITFAPIEIMDLEAKANARELKDQLCFVH